MRYLIRGTPDSKWDKWLVLAMFILIMAGTVFVLWPRRHHPRFDQPIPRTHCMCAGGTLCTSCPKDPVCKCDIDPQSLRDAEARYRAVVRDFANVVEPRSPSQ